MHPLEEPKLSQVSINSRADTLENFIKQEETNCEDSGNMDSLAKGMMGRKESDANRKSSRSMRFRNRELVGGGSPGVRLPTGGSD